MRKVDIRDVAHEAGVSVTTVSRVLNDSPSSRVSEATRARVQEVAKRLNYRPNRMARGLRTRTSGMIGLLTEEIAATPHAGGIILGAQDAAYRHHLTLAIVNSPLRAEASPRRGDVLALLDRQVDGMIYATVFHREVQVPEELRAVPAVLIGAVDRRLQLPAVVPDEVAGAREAVELLIGAGHRRIGFAGNATDVPATRGRYDGYAGALEAAGLGVDPALVVRAESEAAGGYEAVSALLDLPVPPTAVFCYDDRMAMGAYRAVQERGLVVPRDVSIVGFDNQEPIASSLFPGLTTVALPHYAMGAWAVDTIADLVAGKDAAPGENPLRMRCPIVTRGSVAEPPATPTEDRT